MAGKNRTPEENARREKNRKPLYLQKFHSIEHFKQERIDYPVCCNSQRMKAKLKGLPPAIHRQQTLSVA